jgi:PAS domain S-box-containing protein
MKKILAIDDNNENLSVISALLAESLPGAHLISAESGREGIELCLLQKPDVILLDMVMPDMHGHEICKILKSNEGTKNIPIVILTAPQTDQKSRISALNSGADGFLMKPLDDLELKLQMQAMLRIKESEDHKITENERLAMLVAKRTQELEQSHNETLKLLDELKAEIETRKKTEMALRESETHFRTLANSGLALIWTAGLDKKCNYFNESWLNFTGRTIEQELGDGWLEGVHPEDIQRCIDVFITAFDRREKFTMEYRVRHVSGDYRWIQDDGMPRYNSDHEFMGFIGHCLDITGRKKSELTLKQSEAKFHGLFTQMTEGFAFHEVIYDLNHKAVDYKIIDINPAYEKQVGITAEKAVGKLATQLYDVSPAPYLDIYAQVAETGEHQFFQTFFPPLGKYFEISVFSPNRGSFATIFTDITDRTKAEEQLRESEQRFKNLVRDMQVGVIVQGPHAEIVMSNPRALEMLGLSEDQLLGKTSFDPDWNVIHEDGSPFPGSMHPVPRAIASRESVRNVVMGVFRPAGHDRIWLLVDAVPQLNSDGTINQVVCTFIDISKRKKAEAKLKESEVIFSQLMEHSPIYIFFKDENIRSFRLSHNFEEMLGKSMDELIGKTMNELFPSEFAKNMVEDDLQILRDGKIINIEEELNGRSYSTVKFPVQIKEGLSFLAGFTIDITERKLAEKALLESETRLRELNATKDKFFSIISHDLKSPFSAILGFSNILIDQVKDKDYEAIEEYAQIIHNSSKRAMGLLTNLLVWSRSQTGRMAFNPEVIEMVTLINEVTELLSDAAYQKSITISKRLPHSIITFADRAMISTILRNLISNAIKFTNREGQLVISASQTPAELIIAVADNGIGIKKEMIEKLFRIDENHSTKGTENEVGTGLGLVLCQEFVNKNNGKIWVESEPLKGSTFYFTIPKS